MPTHPTKAPVEDLLQRLSSMDGDKKYSLAVGFKVSTLRHIIKHMAIPNQLAVGDVIRNMVDDVVKDDLKAHPGDKRPHRGTGF